MHWFKIHHGFCADSKLGLIAHQLNISRALINGIFMDMLEYASRNPDRGSIDGYDLESSAFSLGIDKEILSNALLSLRNRYVVTHDRIANWEQYQAPEDHTNAERQRRYRDNKKQLVKENITPVTERNALRNTDKSREDKKDNTPIVPTGDFDEFWKVCAKKVGKKEAQKSYLRALKETTHEEIMAAMIKYAAARRGEDAKYTQAPAAWLNKGRWADEFTVAQPQTPRSAML